MARAPRGGSWPAEYAERIRRAKARHPGITTAGARGHGGPPGRNVNRLLRALDRLPQKSTVAFTGQDRQADGTWNEARFDLLPGDGSDEQTFVVATKDLGRLAEIRDVIAASGFLTLGKNYLDRMTQKIGEALYAIRARRPSGKQRSRRWLAKVGPKGRAVTRFGLDDRVMISPDPRRLAAYIARHGLAARYLVEPI